MKLNFSISQPFIAFILLIAFLLQSCGIKNSNTPESHKQEGSEEVLLASARKSEASDRKKISDALIEAKITSPEQIEAVENFTKELFNNGEEVDRKLNYWEIPELLDFIQVLGKTGMTSPAQVKAIGTLIVEEKQRLSNRYKYDSWPSSRYLIPTLASLEGGLTDPEEIRSFIHTITEFGEGIWDSTFSILEGRKIISALVKAKITSDEAIKNLDRLLASDTDPLESIKVLVETNMTTIEQIEALAKLSDGLFRKKIQNKRDHVEAMDYGNKGNTIKVLKQAGITSLEQIGALAKLKNIRMNEYDWEVTIKALKEAEMTSVDVIEAIAKLKPENLIGYDWQMIIKALKKAGMTSSQQIEAFANVIQENSQILFTEGQYISKAMIKDLNKGVYPIPENGRPYDTISSLMIANLLESPSVVAAMSNISKEPKGAARAQYEIGLMYLKGQGVKKNNAKAMQLFQKAADQGLAEAQNELGKMYYTGEGVKMDKVKAAQLFQKAADQGMARAQYNLGLLHSRGDGVEYDKVKAKQFFRQAADQGHEQAQAKLIEMDSQGDEVEKNKVKQVQLLQQFADQGDAEAQYQLGEIYSFGPGVEKNITKAINFYQQAAAQGSAKAQYRLAFMYSNGDGITKDQVKALHLYQQAADQDYAPAICNLAILYRNGKVIQRDTGKIVELYQRAADLGYAPGQRELGLMYLTGYHGVIQIDKVKAKELLQEAAKQGDEKAQSKLKELN